MKNSSTDPKYKGWKTLKTISAAFQGIQKALLIPYIFGLQYFVNFWTILGDVWEAIVFLKGLVKFRQIRNIGDLM